MPNKPGSKGFEADDNKFVPAKLEDRTREGQSNEIKITLEAGNTYGVGDSSFNDMSKVTKPGGFYQNYSGPVEKEYGNFSEKNASISRHDMTGKQTANCGTAYNSEPIPETYKPATSNGVPNANAIEYNTEKKNRS